MKRQVSIILLFAFLFVFYNTKANNIAVTSISTVDSAGFTFIQFNLSWDNSWRTSSAPSNFDGAWVFMKYKDLDGKWKHMHILTATPAVVPAGFSSKLSQVNNLYGAAGVMIWRSANGSGTSTLTGVRLPVQSLVGTYDLRVFAIEMVFVPGGGAAHNFNTAPFPNANMTNFSSRMFYGDGDGTTETASAFHSISADNTAVDVTASVNWQQDTIEVDANALDDAQLESGIIVDINRLVLLPPYNTDNREFPTGHTFFWCMKHEISHAAYRDFLNTLTYNQQIFNTSVAPNSAIGTNAVGGSFLNRSYLEIKTPGVPPSGGSTLGTAAVYGVDGNTNNIFDETDDGEWIAMHRISWSQLCAFLDWAGLRPMTELEFEVACHGAGGGSFLQPDVGDFAWGYTARCTNTYTITGQRTTAEAISNTCATDGNAIYSLTGLTGPARCGVFATATSNRLQAGATYWGIMEMSGNVWERVVTVGNVAGRSFQGTINFGDGSLNDAGQADVNTWPGINGNTDATVANGAYNETNGIGVNGAAGSGFRGGAYNTTPPAMRIANRDRAADNDNTMSNGYGGRGVIYILP
jgi:formylglycine-generating enzyme required for sulfatase activity